MNTEFSAHDHHHPLGDSATHPSRPRWVTLAALLLLAGIGPQRRRVLPAHPIAAFSSAFTCRF